MALRPLPDRPCIGIVGSAGAYGRWLRTFFAGQMRLEVVGHDPADPASLDPDAVLARADVLVFATPIRRTVDVIDAWVQRGAGREGAQLWLDVTSIKAGPVAAMLRSRAEVAGLHPMTAPPRSPTLRGRVLAVCEARLDRWRPWFDTLLAALEADCARTTPARHDQAMALVQALVHASHLAATRVLGGAAGTMGGIEQLLPLRTALFEMDVATASRMLSLNPAIYEDIQFGNPAVPAVLQALAGHLARIAALVRQGDGAARAAFRAEFLDANREAFSDAGLATGNYTFERIAYLLADLNDAHALSVHLPEDHAGSLRKLLAVFERHGVSVASLHSSRTPAGELHFRFGFGRGVGAAQLRAIAIELADRGIGRVIAA